MENITDKFQNQNKLPPITIKGSASSPQKKVLFQGVPIIDVTGQSSPSQIRFTPLSEASTVTNSDFSSSYVTESSEKSPAGSTICTSFRPIDGSSSRNRNRVNTDLMKPLEPVQELRNTRVASNESNHESQLILNEINDLSEDFLSDSIEEKSPITALLHLFSSPSIDKEIAFHQAAQVAGKFTFEACLKAGLDKKISLKASCFAVARVVNIGIGVFSSYDKAKKLMNPSAASNVTRSDRGIHVPSTFSTVDFFSNIPQAQAASAAAKDIIERFNLPLSIVNATVSATYDATAVAVKGLDFQKTIKKIYQKLGVSQEATKRSLLFNAAASMAADVTYRAMKEAGYDNKVTRETFWLCAAATVYDAHQTLNLVAHIEGIAKKDDKFNWSGLAHKILEAPEIVEDNSSLPQVARDATTATALLIHENPLFKDQASGERDPIAHVIGLAAVNATRFITTEVIKGINHQAALQVHNEEKQKSWRDALMTTLQE
ncbi:MAG: hypothetical protein A3F67_05945 [Verrucomicrobia bacterium RIFCSPHIGHO2_12_FULL_41_10]|nr:MAG: hypothetical protein A3F67_05945 [Verrucomicrobia bacterium RIFCSPHIGHO2_12_FULL_41_10]HLB34796.1 hypothetical protein [Chthoniobacterales bacterium]